MRSIADTSPVSIIKGGPAAPFLFVCEHASRHIPEEFGNLGLDDTVASSHIAWDPGALDVTEKLSASFNATAVCGTVSRLIYDLNRSPGAADAMPAKSEIFEVPGNQNLSPDHRSQRVETYYRPFHQALEDQLKAQDSMPALVTIHSFTPTYAGQERAVEIGILHDEDTRFADAMLSIASAYTSMNIMRNEPYGPEHGVTHTLKEHGLENGILNVMIEVRNDLLETHSQCTKVAALLTAWLSEALEICRSGTPSLEAKA